MRTGTSYSKMFGKMTWLIALLLVVFTAGCDRDKGGVAPPASTVPRVIFTIPSDGSTGVPINRKISAAFSEPMSAASITAGSFQLQGPGSTVVTASTITYDPLTRVALFTPTANLLNNTIYTGTITVGAKNPAGTALANNFVWIFTTGAAPDVTAPLLLITAPVNTATNVPVNQKITATFNEPMDATTITPATYTVTGPTGTIPGNISYLGATATFEPISLLTTSTTYTVVIAASDLAGNAWVSGNVANPWSFTTVPTPGPIIVVPLGLAAPFGVAATAGITNTPTAPITHINGNVVLDTNQTCNAVTVDNTGGFGLCGGSPPTHNVGDTVITQIYPDTTTADAVKADLMAAFISITPPAGPPAAGGLGGGTPIASPTTLGDITGNPLVLGDNLFHPGVYISITSILITGDLTLDGQGDPNAVFVFQSASSLTTAAGPVGPGHTRILLVNGAKASNVWWQVGTSATLGTNTEFQGNILASASITMTTGATSCGRLFAGGFTAGAFVFDSNVVSVPGHPNAPVGCQ